MSEETQKQSDSPGDQGAGTQRCEGPQFASDDEGRRGASPEDEEARNVEENMGSDHERQEGAPRKGKSARKIIWAMRFLP